VSRKFVYQQAHKAGAALDDAFLSGAPEDEVLFQLTVTPTWLRQVIVALTLICRSSYRGVVEFMRGHRQLVVDGTAKGATGRVATGDMA
jgi:hypothetical protein